jgi:hypothetical protein
MTNAEKMRKTKPIIEIDEELISGEDYNPEKVEKAHI